MAHYPEVLREHRLFVSIRQNTHCNVVVWLYLCDTVPMLSQNNCFAYVTRRLFGITVIPSVEWFVFEVVLEADRYKLLHLQLLAQIVPSKLRLQAWRRSASAMRVPVICLSQTKSHFWRVVAVPQRPTRPFRQRDGGRPAGFV